MFIPKNRMTPIIAIKMKIDIDKIKIIFTIGLILTMLSLAIVIPYILHDCGMEGINVLP
jgi:hypothetical protein